MPKAWIIIKGWGEYSDRNSRPERVYLDGARAKSDMAKLDGIYNKYRPVIWPEGYVMQDYRAAERISPQMKAEYAAIGFDADWSDDWELDEAELVE